MSRGRARRENRWKLWDEPKKKPARDAQLPKVARSAGRVEHTQWAKEFVKTHGLEKALQITRRLAVDFHIGHKKQSELNLRKDFYRAAFNYMRNTYNQRAQALVTPVDKAPEASA